MISGYEIWKEVVSFLGDKFEFGVGVFECFDLDDEVVIELFGKGNVEY